MPRKKTPDPSLPGYDLRKLATYLITLGDCLDSGNPHCGHIGCALRESIEAGLAARPSFFSDVVDKFWLISIALEESAKENKNYHPTQERLDVEMLLMEKKFNNDHE